MSAERTVLLSAGDAGTIVLFLGSFLDRFCCTELQKLCGAAEGIEAVRSDDLLDHIDAGDGRRIQLRAARLPYGLRLRAELTQPIGPDRCDLVLCLAQFPYERWEQVGEPFDRLQQDLIRGLSAGRMDLPQYRIVFLVDPNRRYSATDSVRQTEALQRLPGQIAEAILRKEPERQFLVPLVDYWIYRSGEDLVPVLYQNSRMRTLVTAASRQQFAAWNDRLDSEFFLQDLNYDYEMRLEEEPYSVLRSHEASEAVMRFSNMPKRRKVWQVWADRYHKRYFALIFDLASRFYAGYIDDIRFWDRRSDEQTLYALLDQRYQEQFSAKKAAHNFICPDHPAEYQFERNRTKLDISFAETIDAFLNQTVKECVCGYLMTKRKALSALFGNGLSHGS